MTNFHGINLGSAGAAIHSLWVQACDLVLHSGVLGSEITTFGFTALPQPAATIVFDKYSVRLGTKAAVSMDSRCISIKTTLLKLLVRLKGLSIPVPNVYPEDQFLPHKVLKGLTAVPDGALID